jgi:uncharacterized protein YlzI (FlbEa/FlbD family)
VSRLRTLPLIANAFPADRQIEGSLSQSGEVCRERASWDGVLMIHLTRLNNQPIVVNADLIKFIENAPDTVLTLVTGEKLIVREPAAEVLKRIHEFHQQSAQRFRQSKVSGSPEHDGAGTDSAPTPEFPEDEKS